MRVINLAVSYVFGIGLLCACGAKNEGLTPVKVVNSLQGTWTSECLDNRELAFRSWGSFFRQSNHFIGDGASFTVSVFDDSECLSPVLTFDSRGSQIINRVEGSVALIDFTTEQFYLTVYSDVALEKINALITNQGVLPLTKNTARNVMGLKLGEIVFPNQDWHLLATKVAFDGETLRIGPPDHNYFSINKGPNSTRTEPTVSMRKSQR